MPSGKVHNKINLIIILFLSPLIIIRLYFYWFIIGMTFSTYFMSPDLDLPNSMSRNKHGCLWRWFWFIYDILLKHRSKLSHWFILGTTIRYITILWIPAAFLFAYFPDILNSIWKSDQFQLCFTGSCIADGIYDVADSYSTFFKRRYRNVNRNK
jgi:uncharacterized metal-binding protein